MNRLLIGLVLAATATPAAADDWPQWLGPKRDGVWRETGTIDTFPAGGAKVLWRAPVGMGYAGPAVADGKVYVPDRVLTEGQANPANPFDKAEVQGSERVQCLDARTGNKLWTHAYPSAYRISYAAGPRCTPTVDGDRVYALGAMGDLFCLEAASGAVRWAKNFVKDYKAEVPVWGFAAHPLVDGNLLICLAGGSDGRLVIAFDKMTGKEVWTALSCSGDFGYAPPVIYDLAGRRTLVVWHTKALVGLEPETGKKLWQVPFEVKAALTAPMPRRVGTDQVFVTSFYNGSMLVRATPDGAAVVVWKSKARGERPNLTTDLSSIIPTPFVQDGFVYGVDSYGQLRCLKAETGERVWATMQATRGHLTPEKVRQNPEPSEGPPWNERWANAFLVMHGDQGTGYVLFNEQGELIFARLTPNGYEETGRAEILKPTNRMAGRPVVWTHPAFADRKAFVRNDTEIVCVDLAK